jgi:ribose/xylose/arabinose/galactoside ABC-type transport system permease subunit
MAGLAMIPDQPTILYSSLAGCSSALIPVQFMGMIAFAPVTWFFLNRPRLGGHVFLTGDTMDSARLMGASVGCTRLLTLVITGGLHHRPHHAGHRGGSLDGSVDPAQLRRDDRR